MSVKQTLSKLRRRTWIIIGAAVVVLAVAAGVVFGVVLPGAAQAKTIDATATASLETMEQTVTGTGTLAPLVDEDVDFAVSGTVTSVAVQAGSVVTAGQKLATVDTLQLNADLLSAKATLADAEARLADSSTSTARAANEASVEVAEAGVTTAQASLSKATLVAPVAGTVTSVDVAVGDSVGSSGSGGSGGSGGAAATSTAAFHIVGTDAWTVTVALGEADLALIAKNDQVELSLTDGTKFFGTVSTIGLLPDTTSGAATYPVVVNVTGTAKGLFDGVSVTAAVVYERRTDVLTVPSAAVTTASGKSTVTVIESDGSKKVITVTVGESSGNLTEIKKGISEGDKILVATFTPGSGNSGTGGNGNFTGGNFPGGTFPGGNVTGGGPNFQGGPGTVTNGSAPKN